MNSRLNIIVSGEANAFAQSLIRIENKIYLSAPWFSLKNIYSNFILNQLINQSSRTCRSVICSCQLSWEVFIFITNFMWISYFSNIMMYQEYKSLPSWSKYDQHLCGSFDIKSRCFIDFHKWLNSIWIFLNYLNNMYSVWHLQ